jgi:hypothetical protein
MVKVVVVCVKWVQVERRGGRKEGRAVGDVSLFFFHKVRFTKVFDSVLGTSSLSKNNYRSRFKRMQKKEEVSRARA